MDESVEDIIPLPKQLVGDGDLIMLRVVGESMIDAAIADGDWVVVRRETDIENGDIVAAMIESDTSGDREATVKTFKRVDGHVWLIPHNPAFTPLMADNAEIVGKVVSVLRGSDPPAVRPRRPEISDRPAAHPGRPAELSWCSVQPWPAASSGRVAAVNTSAARR